MLTQSFKIMQSQLQFITFSCHNRAWNIDLSGGGAGLHQINVRGRAQRGPFLEAYLYFDVIIYTFLTPRLQRPEETKLRPDRLNL